MKKSGALFFVIFLLSAVFVGFAPASVQGAYEGLRLACDTVVPSLLPMLILFLILMKSEALTFITRLFGWIAVRLFNLPAVCTPAIITGLAGGYPTGALMTLELYSSDEIDGAQAERLMCFNFCGGVGFIVTALGSARLGSTRLGAVLYLSNLTASLVIGFLLSFTEKRGNMPVCALRASMPIPDALVSSVNSAVKSVISLTAYIMLFSGFLCLLPSVKYLVPIFEITSGVCGKESFSAELLSAYLAFGGLCVHLQLLPVIRKFHMSYLKFLFFRLLCSALSALACRALLLFIPVTQSVFSNESIKAAKLTGVSPAMSFLLVLGGALFFSDLASRRIIHSR